MKDFEKICTPDYADEGIALVDDVHSIHFDKLQHHLPELVVLVFVRQGNMNVEYDGREEQVQKGEFLFCSPGRSVINPEYSDDFQAHGILFSIRFAQQILTTTGNIWRYLSHMRKSPVLKLPVESVTTLNSYYNLLLLEVRRTNNLYYHEIVPSLIRNLLYTLINDMRQSSMYKDNQLSEYSESYSGSPQAMSLFQKFVEMLTNEQCCHRDIGHYAARLCVSAKYLSTVCKQISQRTARQWICDSMINGIEGYLRYSNKTIKEISVIYGFPNMSVFSKFVKKNLGVTPNKCRK